MSNFAENPARILVVDDGSAPVDLHTDGFAAIVQVHPEDLRKDHLENAELVLLDFVLKTWPERDGTPALCRAPLDGLAVSKTVRRNLLLGNNPHPTGVAILTEEPHLLSEPYPPDNRSHILARINDLEWVFYKKDPSLAGKLLSMVAGIRMLPERWSAETSQAFLQLVELLQVPQAESDRCRRSIIEARPPLHDMVVWSHGLAVIRWVAHRILPYPCFLVDSHSVAAWAGLDPAEFNLALVNSPALRAFLKPAEYTGLLNDFMGARWWKAPLEELFASRGALDRMGRGKIITLLDENLKDMLLHEDRLVVSLDERLMSTDEVLREEDAVRILADDWPHFADLAYTSREQLQKSDYLKTLQAGALRD